MAINHMMLDSYNHQFIDCGSMQRIQIDNINIKKNRAQPIDIIPIEITFSAIQPLSYPLQWKIIYVGSAFSEDYDQTLQDFEIGEIQRCETLKFEIQCNAPDLKKIPREELLCTTALIITASYCGQQFVRIGYYVHHLVTGEIGQSMSIDQIITRTQRVILSEKPRITKFPIDWQKNKKQEVSKSNRSLMKKILNNQQSKQLEESVEIKSKKDKSNNKSIIEENWKKIEFTKNRCGQILSIETHQEKSQI